MFKNWYFFHLPHVVSVDFATFFASGMVDLQFKVGSEPPGDAEKHIEWSIGGLIGKIHPLLLKIDIDIILWSNWKVNFKFKLPGIFETEIFFP